MSHKRSPRRIKTAQTVFGIVEILYQNDGATMSEVAEELNMAVSTVHDHIATLESMNYVVRRNDNKFYLSLRFLDYGIDAKYKFKVVRVSQSILRELAREISEAVWLFVEENYSIVGIHNEGGNIVKPSEWLGKHQPLHCTAGGKALLAHYDEEKVEQAINHYGLKEITPNTITDEMTLYDELEKIRERGYALNDGETIKHVRGVASPIIVNEEVLGAVCVVGPEHRLKEEQFTEKIPQRVGEAVSEIELDMTDFISTTPFTHQ